MGYFYNTLARVFTRIIDWKNIANEHSAQEKMDLTCTDLLYAK